MPEPALPLIGITMGDPAGTGPEMVVKTIAREQVYQACRPIVLADAQVMEQAIGIAGVPLLLRTVKQPSEGRFKQGTLEVLDMRNVQPNSIALGKRSAESARAAVQCVQRAVEMALNRVLDGVAAGPIAAKGLWEAGYQQATQAELIADLAKSGRHTTMLMAGSLRVTSATGCTTLGQALEQLSKGRVFAAIRLTNQALQRLGIQHPRIGVAALNPCTYEREPGPEETREIIPAIEESKQDRVDVQGPFAAEELLPKLAENLFDAVVVMYHDQGFPAAKVLNTRLGGIGKTQPAVLAVMGLPTACTVVDRDPEFESAGKGVASEHSLLEAVQLAARLAAGALPRRRSSA